MPQLGTCFFYFFCFKFKSNTRNAAEDKESFIRSTGFKKHDAIRRALRAKYDVDVPTFTEMLERDPGSPGWAKYLPVREQDCIIQYISNSRMKVDDEIGISKMFTNLSL